MQSTILKLPGANDFFTQEAFKALRTNLQFCGQDIHTVVITSCNENDRGLSGGGDHQQAFHNMHTAVS